MTITVHPSQLSGTLRANPSKSYTQRAYALAALAHTPSVIRHPSDSDDGRAALGVAQNLGAKIHQETDLIRITPRTGPFVPHWRIGESGLSFRMFAAIAALQTRTVSLQRSGSLRTRPVDFVVEALQSLGVVATADEDSGDLLIKGPLRGGSYKLDGSMSSQFITGLLIALPLAAQRSVLTVESLRSKPYVRMTLDMIRRFGGLITYQDARDVFRIPGGQVYSGTDVTIEGDWSGIAFLLVAGAIAGEVTVEGAAVDSLQGDKAIVEVIKDAGALVETGDDQVTVHKAELRAFTFDATDCPDLFPPLAVLAACCDGTSKIAGISRLTHKESDRYSTIKQELGNLGVEISAEKDEMLVRGAAKIRGGNTQAHGDHRIAMMLACAALCADGPVAIDGAACVSKSYPGFFEDLKRLGGSVE